MYILISCSSEEHNRIVFFLILSIGTLLNLLISVLGPSVLAAAAPHEPAQLEAAAPAMPDVAAAAAESGLIVVKK